MAFGQFQSYFVSSMTELEADTTGEEKQPSKKALKKAAKKEEKATKKEEHKQVKSTNVGSGGANVSAVDNSGVDISEGKSVCFTVSYVLNTLFF